MLSCTFKILQKILYWAYKYLIKSTFSVLLIFVVPKYILLLWYTLFLPLKTKTLIMQALLSILMFSY